MYNQPFFISYVYWKFNQAVTIYPLLKVIKKTDSMLKFKITAF